MRDKKGRFIKGIRPWNTGLSGWTEKSGAGFQKGHGYLGGGAKKSQRVSIKSEFKKGLTPWNKGLKGVMPIPWNKGIKTGHTPWNKGKIWEKMRGSNHPNWKGGTTIIRKRLKTRIEYKNWRRVVFERDNFTCQICGVRGGELQADHIKPWARFPELRYEINNGRTLCIPCHKLTETYGRKSAKAITE